MSTRFTPLLALFLVTLLTFGAQAHAQAPRFARGFVIYKKVPSDQPAYYGGSLYLDYTSGPVWLEYDVGQAKPFLVARDLYVNEIKFGALFEADFTSDAHVQFCKNVQAQLLAAAKPSPILAPAAKAAAAAIQAEVDRYEKGSVRLSGKWVDRAQYDTMLATAEAARKASMAERAAEDESIRKSKIEQAAMLQLRQGNLTHSYSSTATRYLVQPANFELTISDTLATVEAGGKLPDAIIPYDFPGTLQLPQTRNAIPMLWQSGSGTSETSGSMLCTYNDSGQLVLADLVLYLISDPASHTLLNREETGSMQKILDKFDPEIFENLPDVLAATRIKAVLRDKVTTVKLTTTHMILPKFHVYLSVDFPVPYQESNPPQGKPPQTKQQQFVLIQIRPLAL